MEPAKTFAIVFTFFFLLLATLIGAEFLESYVKEKQIINAMLQSCADKASTVEDLEKCVRLNKN